MIKYVLASGSPRRKELLSRLGIEYDVITSEADESIEENEPQKIVYELSKRKALAVKKRIINDIQLSELYNEGNTVIIGADTIVCLNNQVLGKPNDRKEAITMLSTLSGKNHQVFTGITLLHGDKIIQFCEKTDVELYDMKEDEIISYVESGEPFDKAGAYGIQGRFSIYVRKISGDYNNVVGLPTARLYHELKKAGLL